jgi:RHS repeat-associated protein
MGNRLMMTDSHGTTNYEYDELNRLLNVLNPDCQTVGYMYDAVGNRVWITYPDDKRTSYAYDANNRLIGVTDWDDHITSYAYDTNGNLIGMTYPNEMETEYIYDEDNRLIELINKNEIQVVSSFEYTMDAVGNRLRVNETFLGRFECDDLEFEEAQPLTTIYEYDKLYRLTKVGYPFDETVSYNYDSMGNRISMTATIDGIDSTVDYIYDAADRLLQSGSITFAYDNNGNLIEKSENPGRVMSYSYDGANRLIGISTLFGSQRDLYNFEYDGDGNRIGKTIMHGKSTQSIEYVLDVNSVLPQVLTESDKKGTTIHTYGLDLISMTDPQRGEFYYHHDGLGSVRSLSDSKESIKTIYLYDAFGQLRKEMGHVDNDFLFTGEQMDDETGLIYLRARYYDPSVGRFITRDPILGNGYIPSTLNRYVYVGNNPINFIDPQGLCAEDGKTVKNIVDLSSGLALGELGIHEWVFIAAKNRPFGQSLKPFYETRKNLRFASDAMIGINVVINGAEELQERGITGQKLWDSTASSHSNLIWAIDTDSTILSEALLDGFTSVTAVSYNTLLSPAIVVDELLGGKSSVKTSGEEIENWVERKSITKDLSTILYYYGWY